MITSWTLVVAILFNTPSGPTISVGDHAYGGYSSEANCQAAAASIVTVGGTFPVWACVGTAQTSLIH